MLLNRAITFQYIKMQLLFKDFSIEHMLLELHTLVSINFEFVSRCVRATSTSFGLSFVSFNVPFGNLMCPMQLHILHSL